MSLKKVLAFACSLAMSATMMTSFVTAEAATEGCTLSLDFAGYEVVSAAATFAKVDVNLTIPETLSPYAENEPDWVTSFDYTYSGVTLQGMGVDIPYVDGLTFVAAKSTKGIVPITITANKIDSKAQLSYVATGAFNTYYSGAISTKLATLYYLVSDTSATYNLTPTDCVVGLAKWDGTSNSLPTVPQYIFKDFTVTGATIKPDTIDEKTEWTNTDSANIPAGQKIVAHSQNVTGVTADTRVAVTIGSETKTFGNNIGNYFTSKGIDLEGTADLDVRFAVLVDSTVDASDVSFNIQ